MNELIFLVTIFAVFGYVLLCFYFGRRWLYSAIAINLILIGIFGAKLISLFGNITNVGNIFYAAVFLAGQLLVEHYGKDEGKRSIWVGVSSTIFFVLLAQLTVRFISIPESREVSAAIGNLFKFTPRIAIASVVAYLFSQTLNIYLYDYISAKKPESIWFRSTIASTLGQFLDSTIFFSIAFWGSIPLLILMNTAVTGFVIKATLGIIAIPFIYLSYRLKTKREILEEESLAILTEIGEGVAVTDRNGIILVVNKMFEELLGWKANEVIGKKMTDVVSRENEAGKKVHFKEEILTEVLSGKKMVTTSTNHTYFVRKDGSRFPVRLVVTPIRIEHKITGAVEIFSDVIAEKQLDNMRTDFLSLASHQLRTPLSGTRWVIETLKNGIVGELNPKQREYIDELYEINNQMIALSSDTLQILHLENEKVPIKKEKFSVKKLYEDISKTLGMTAKEKGLIIEISSETTDATIESDIIMVKNIIQSFVSNAINYSANDKKVTLSIKESPIETVLSVKDYGIGIPKEEQAKIFERFFRASNAKTLRVDGTGLGLSISKMIAEKIGTKISFESEENNGSEFSLHIPNQK